MYLLVDPLNQFFHVENQASILTLWHNLLSAQLFVEVEYVYIKYILMTMTICKINYFSKIKKKMFFLTIIFVGLIQQKNKWSILMYIFLTLIIYFYVCIQQPRHRYNGTNVIKLSCHLQYILAPPSRNTMPQTYLVTTSIFFAQPNKVIVPAVSKKST